jgi:hypothetical protein
MSLSHPDVYRKGARRNFDAGRLCQARKCHRRPGSAVGDGFCGLTASRVAPDQGATGIALLSSTHVSSNPDSKPAGV